MTVTIAQMKQRKKELGYSYAQIAERAGLPLGTVQKVLGGITESPRHSTLTALERALFPASENSISYKDVIEESQKQDSRRMLTGETAASYQITQDPRLRKFGKKQGEYTLQDREAFPEDLRTELIDGVIYLMASPSPVHQIVAGQIYHQLCSFIYSRSGPCTPFIAPSDVRLDRDDFTVVQPDVYVVCKEDTDRSTESDSDSGIQYGHYINAAPAFIAEILSPSTRTRDMTIKAEKYRKAGVREYWIVDPLQERVIIFWFGDEPDISISGFDERIPVRIYDGECTINFMQIRERVNRYL